MNFQFKVVYASDDVTAQNMLTLRKVTFQHVY